jgi:hypothetical protein
MFSCFKFIRFVISLIVAILLCITLTLGIPLSILSHKITDKENVENWLKESGLYNTVQPIVGQQLYKPFVLNVPFHDLVSEDELIDIVNKVFPPEWLETVTEQVVDAFYSWARGETEKLEFEISFKDRQVIMKNEMSGLLKKKLSSYPLCPKSLSIKYIDFDILKEGCLPQDFALSQIDMYIGEQIDQNQLFLNNTVTAENLPVSPSLTHRIQNIYKTIEHLPLYVSGAVFILTILLFIFIPSLKSKFFFTGLIWIMSGVALFWFSAVGVKRFDTFFERESGKISNENIQEISSEFQKPLHESIVHMSTEIRSYALIVTVLGSIMSIGGLGLSFVRPRYFLKEDAELEENKKKEPIT